MVSSWCTAHTAEREGGSGGIWGLARALFVSAFLVLAMGPAVLGGSFDARCFSAAAAVPKKRRAAVEFHAGAWRWFAGVALAPLGGTVHGGRQ